MKVLKKVCSWIVAIIILFNVIPSITTAATSEATTGVEKMLFSIPANTFCDQSHLVELSLNITNLNSTSEKIKLDFIKNDGTIFKDVGTTYNGISSVLTPGSSVSVEANHTATYHFTFGGQSTNCADKPFVGTFSTSGANNVSLIASGFVSSSLYSVPIIINGGNVWSSKPITGSTEPVPPVENTPVPINKPVDKCSVTSTNSLIHAMSASSDVYGKASSSSYDHTFDTQAYRAFDNNCNPFATKSGDKTGWLEYDFTDAKTVTGYSMQMKQNDTQYGFLQSPKSWVFEAYDGKNWVALDTQTNITAWEPSKANIYQISNSKSYNNYRVRFTENNGGNLVCISELGMMGY